MEQFESNVCPMNIMTMGQGALRVECNDIRISSPMLPGQPQKHSKNPLNFYILYQSFLSLYVPIGKIAQADCVNLFGLVELQGIVYQKVKTRSKSSLR